LHIARVRRARRRLPGHAVPRRTGQCWDNALAESFFATIKGELIDLWPWPARATARRAIDEYTAWFNSTRLHSSLGYLSPAEFETTPSKEITAKVA
jgi:transposase InsO family protein